VQKALFVLLLSFGLLINSTGYADPIAISDAKVVATNFCQQNGFANFSSLSLIYTAKSDDSLAAFYIFNINERDGYVIVAADDIVTPI